MDEDKREELVGLLERKSLHYIEVIPFDDADEDDEDEEDYEEDESDEDDES
jgi:hypothetical protein